MEYMPSSTLKQEYTFFRVVVRHAVDHRASCMISSVDSNCNFSRDKGTVYRKKVSGFLRRRAEDSWRRGSAPFLRARRFRSLKGRGVRHFENQGVVNARSMVDMRSLAKKTRQLRSTIENVAQGLPVRASHHFGKRGDVQVEYTLWEDGIRANRSEMCIARGLLDHCKEMVCRTKKVWGPHKQAEAIY
eukprot:jgi/Picre1/31646/NNA_006997.t1